MRKSKIIGLSFILLFCYFPFKHYLINAQETKSPPIEDQYKEMDYTTPSKAINEFEQTNGKKLFIPKTIPEYLPFKVTHQFGKYENGKGPDLRIEYINEKSLSLFIIMVFPLGKELSFEGKGKMATMKDGTHYSYIPGEKNRFDLFSFKTKNWAYILSTNHKEESTTTTIEKYTTIAQYLKSAK